MRPLKLTMTAFGPYADTEIVDFNELNEKNLFLITGPTGSGKTTIFDAISFAMYGETNGNVRTAESLRSQFADEKKLTEIELEFELKGTKYIIHRIPKQQKPKARGLGFTEQKADATLTIFNDEQPKIISGIKNVNDKIESVIGINAEQFRQIMMIPQGEFRKLLTADSQQRETVLQKLFNTSIYNTIQVKMETQAKTLNNEIKNSRAIRDSAISRIECGDGDRLRFLMDSEDRNINEIVVETVSTLEIDSKALAKLESKIDKEYKELQKLIEEKQKVKENNEKLRNKELLKQNIKEKELRSDNIKSLEHKVKRAEKARAIIEIEKNYDLRKIEFDEKEIEIIDNRKKLVKTMDSFKITKTHFEKVTSDETETKRETLFQEITKLQGYVAKVKEIKTLNESISRAKETFEKIDNQKKTYTEEMNNLKLNIESFRQSKDDAKDASLDLEKVKNEIVKLKDIDKKLKRTLIEHEELQDIKDKISNMESIINKLEKELTIEHDNYKKIKINFHMNQAAILAKDLKEGQQCPVCGSTHHEKLAEFIDNDLTEEKLNRCEEQLKISEDKFNDKKVSLAELKERENQKLSSCETIISELSEITEFNTNKLTIKEIIKTSSFKQDENSQELEKAKKDELTLTKLSKRREQYVNEIQKASEQLQKFEAKLEQVDKDYIEANNKLIEQKLLLEGIFKEVPEYIRDYDKLNVTIHKKEILRNQMLQVLKQAREQFEKMKQELTALKSKGDQIEKDKTKCKEILEVTRNEFENKCLESGFEDHNDYIDSRNEVDKISSLKKEIEDYHKEIFALKEQYADISRKTEGLKIVDILTFDKDIDEKNREHKTLIDTKSSIANRKMNNQKVLEEVEKINSKINEKEKKYALVGHLAKIAKGDNRARMTFERYVLAAFLDDILVAANLRLIKMTGGRYNLSRTDELERKNKQSGLELEVYDNYTGKSRHVKTLSGGESFKASLSIALGLSDVVQSYAGGVRLDTMFIDEGFGTLDPESLDSAISCMIDIQKSGRLVGIISHVPELKERIDARLEVHTTNTGSITKFVV